MVMGYGVCLVVGCDYLRESWLQSHGTMGLNATGQERARRESQSVADCRAGMERSLSLDILVESTPKNSISNIVIAIAALLQFHAPVPVSDV